MAASPGAALVTLVVGLGATCVGRACAHGGLDLLGLLPSGFVVGESALSGLTTVNDATIGVALAAGVAGMLAFETRASSAVGVAISMTTIPAAAYFGVAVGRRRGGQGVGRAGRPRGQRDACCWWPGRRRSSSSDGSRGPIRRAVTP